MAIEAGDVLWTVRADTRSFKAGMRDAKAAGDQLASGFMKNSRAIGAAMTIVGAGITAMFAGAASSAASFQREMARVNTLGVKDLGEIEKTVKEVAVAFGIDLADGAKAAYQAISAGASEVELPNVLADSAKAATAGFTDLTTAIDLGMGVLNAFGGELKDVNEVFDLTFIAIEKGVTDFEQLAAGVGDIAPLFKAAGVAADEMFAAISAITLGGVQTSKAVTGLKGAITGILKPTADMTALFEDMGGPMKAIQELGFLGFLEEIKERTGGSADELAKLFGSVEGLGAVLALTGSGAADFAETLEKMRNGVSATDEAFQRFLDANPAFAFEQMKAALKLLSVEIGKVLLPLMVDFARGVKDVVVGVLAWKDASPLAWKGLVLLASGVGGLLLLLGPMVILLPSIAAGVTLFGTVSGAASFGVGALAIATAALSLALGAFAVVAAGLGLVAIAAFVMETLRLGQAMLESKASGDAATEGLQNLIESYERAGIAIDRAALAGLNWQETMDALAKQVEAQRGSQRAANVELVNAEIALRKTAAAARETIPAIGGLSAANNQSEAAVSSLLGTMDLGLGVFGNWDQALIQARVQGHQSANATAQLAGSMRNASGAAKGVSASVDDVIAALAEMGIEVPTHIEGLGELSSQSSSFADSQSRQASASNKVAASLEAVLVQMRIISKGIAITGPQVQAMGTAYFRWASGASRTSKALEPISGLLDENFIALVTVNPWVWNTASGYQALGRSAGFAADQLEELNAALGSVGGFASGGVVPGFASGGTIPGFANGGRVVQVGEAGPELAFLPVGTQILSHGESKQALSEAAQASRPLSMTLNIAPGAFAITESTDAAQTAKDIVDLIAVELGNRFQDAQVTF